MVATGDGRSYVVGFSATSGVIELFGACGVLGADGAGSSSHSLYERVFWGTLQCLVGHSGGFRHA